MIKTYKLRNLLMYGEITAPQLETELKKTATLGALHNILTDGGWSEQCLTSKVSRNILFGSATALEAVFTYKHLKEMIWASLPLVTSLKNSATATAFMEQKARSFARRDRATYDIYSGKAFVVKVEVAANSLLSVRLTATISDIAGASSGANGVFLFNTAVGKGDSRAVYLTTLPLKLTIASGSLTETTTVRWLPMDVEGF